MSAKKRILLLCVGNSCRSQMAEGLLRHTAAETCDVYSAGASPSGLNPNAVKVMAELDVDISYHRSKRAAEFAGQKFDYIVTLCDGSENHTCPVFLGRAGKRLHWPFEDPARATGSEEEVLEVFRRVRDRIMARLETFVREEFADETSPRENV